MMILLSAVLGGVLLQESPPTAKIQLSPYALATEQATVDGQVPTGTYESGHCSVSVDKGTADLANCDEIHKRTFNGLTLQEKSPQAGSPAVKLKISSMKAAGTTVELLIDDKGTISEPPQGVRAICSLSSDERWQCVPCENGQCSDGRFKLVDGDPPVTEFVIEQSDRTIKAARRVTAPPKRPSSSREPDPCKGKEGYVRGTTICVRVRPDRTMLIDVPFPKHIVAPNQSIKVVVVYPPSLKKVEVELDGTRGLYEPPLQQPEPGTDASAHAGEPARTDLTYTHRAWSFAPRRVGNVDLKITLTDADNQRTEETVELIVENSYSGALRLGVGLVFPTPDTARNRSYSAVKLPGSEQSEIIATDGGPADFELVLGYAPYAFDFARGGSGRRYVGQTLRQRSAGFAPYIGLGVLQAGKDGVEALKSLHIGLEWEPQRNFSIALTFVARRVTRLGGGLEIGQPYEGEVPTRQAIRFGVGVVFNLSPEFFRFATRNSASFLAQGGAS